MSKIKVYVPHRNNLNMELIQKHFELVNSTSESDIVIAQSTLAPDFDGDFSKVIYIAVEPPLADHRLYCYSKFNAFPLVVTHNPTKSNQIPFTDSDEPQYFPVNPDPSIIPNYTDEDIITRPKGIFYAGMIGPYESQPDAFGGINLTTVRRELGDYILKNIPGSKVIGIGRNGQQTKVQDWRLDKSNQIRDSGCDFVLALENTMLPNYLYEKIWDGFASDKVTLYLGDPTIEKHIPLNCFVDLRPYFDIQTKKFDFEGLKERLSSMTPEEYNEIRRNARKFRETAKDRHKELQDKLTIKLIKFIREYINN
jgi:hypothetical protein